jgi:hypothetical protein
LFEEDPKLEKFTEKDLNILFGNNTLFQRPELGSSAVCILKLNEFVLSIVVKEKIDM